MNVNPHQSQPVTLAGIPLAEADTALLLLHGRGASAADILTLADHLPHPTATYLAPQAANHTWYPQSFLAPLAQNQPWLDSALALVDETVAKIVAAGIPRERLILGGFSQGACLASEYVARHARRYGGVLAFSGGLIGPPGTPRDYAGDLAGTPVFLGCSDQDSHIPADRVRETAVVFEQLGAAVTTRLYPNMGHTIIPDELAHAQKIVAALN